MVIENGSRPLSELEELIGYHFRNRSYLMLALTHKSYGSEQKVGHNERLEFLGDAVLSFLSSGFLYSRFPEKTEGELSPLRAAAVCAETLQRLSREIGIGDFLYLGHGENKTGGREKKNILADAFEALLAAIYLDGGLEAARTFLMPRIIREIENIAEKHSEIDSKTALQQVIQQEEPGALLEYRLVGQTGPDNNKTFMMEAVVNGNVIGSGSGHSKQAAEQEAAREALALFGIRDR